MVKEFISQLPPDKLSPFAKHPYRVREDAAMDELVESIRVHGILSPLLARPKGEGYELVSGHRRRLAAQKLGLSTVPVLVREMTDDEAVILMVDSNLQRENLLPSEKAFAYKMKLEAMKHQGMTCGQVGHKSRDAVSNDDSGRTIQRYIRLTNLVSPLLQMVDDGHIAFSPAVELSYLTRDEQAELWDLIGREDSHTVAVTVTPHEADLPRGKADAGGAVRHSYRGKAQSERAGSHQNRVVAEVFPAQLFCAADGAGDHQAAGGPLPREGQGRTMIFAYWRYTNFFRTIAAERSEDYGAEFTAIAAGHF